ncbi:methyl-accepting chemotaxis protein [Curvivirga sp.]|uniref:methyl-accepting chemotaxis protein n=1 Tax=Curvivirga sp. TaxID=2856848 RepID=UPI003B590E42
MIKNLKMRAKFGILLVLMVFSLTIISLLGSSTIFSVMLEDRKDKIKSVVDSAINVAEGYQKKIDEGILTKEEALKRYYEVASDIKFDNGAGYLFSYDGKGIAQMHGAAPKLVGKDMSQVKDQNGLFVIQELLAASKGKNNGFFSYVWAKPGEDKDAAFEKVSYAAPLPWGHHIGTGLYVDDLEAAALSILFEFVGVAVISLIVVLIIGYLISRDFANTLLGLRENMLAIGNKDYSQEITGIGRRDELGEMADSVVGFRDQAKHNDELRSRQDQIEKENTERRRQDTLAMADSLENRIRNVVESVNKSVSQLQGTSERMASNATQTTDEAGEVSRVTAEASTNVETVSAASTELSSSIQEISRQVAQVSASLRDGVEQVEEANREVSGLSEAAQSIGDVVNLIHDIAEQTNLLALNATIEAARAGEAGKGFAVVANEVKNLASQTSSATGQIEDQVKAIQGQTVASAENINAVTQMINTIDEMASGIASAVEEQNAATGEIAMNVENTATATRNVSERIELVANAAEQTSALSQELHTVAQDLENESNEMKREVDNFLSELRS